MEALFERKGRLSVVAARGWISGWEAARLSAGSLLISDTIAGEGAELLFEGRFAARCEVAIIGAASPEICAVKITDLERPAREGAEPDRGDELAELLPFEVEFCAADYSLSELEGAGVGTIISLDAAYGPSSSATLRVAGIPAGEGRIAVVGERFGILLDSAAGAGRAPAPRRETGSLVEAAEAAARAKVYDWKKPDRFTKASLLGLEAIHEIGLEGLRARVPALAEYRIEGYDQLAWGELAGDGAARPDSILRAAMERPRREYERERQRASPAAAFIQPARPSFALSASDGERISLWLEEERSRADDRPLFAFASGSAVAAFEEARTLLDCLAAGWRRVCDYSFARTDRLGSAPLLEYGDGAVAGDERGLFGDEMIAAVFLRGPGGAMTLAYSGRAVYPVIEALERYGRLRMPL
jgi:flagellar motor switch/type III secretory pathway protein FliN